MGVCCRRGADVRGVVKRCFWGVARGCDGARTTVRWWSVRFRRMLVGRVSLVMIRDLLPGFRRVAQRFVEAHVFRPGYEHRAAAAMHVVGDMVRLTPERVEKVRLESDDE